MAEKKMPKISIGITSLTVILCVLCLTVFSVLSLSTALSERNLSDKRAESVKNYYAAEKEAASLLNEIQRGWKAGGDVQAYVQKEIVDFDGESYHFYQEIDKGQALFIEFCLKDTLEIKSWQVISTADWTPDDSIEVWDGEMIAED